MNKKYRNLSREILIYLLIGGAITASISAPYLMAPAILFAKSKKRHYPKRKFQNSLYYLKRNNLINVESKKGQVNISLTKKGREKAKYNSLLMSVEAKDPQHWDGKWRIVLFDIGSAYNIKRDSLRKMLTKIGFIQLQKSVWLYPYDCEKVVGQLKEYFNLSDNECRLITSDKIGSDVVLKRYFGL